MDIEYTIVIIMKIDEWIFMFFILFQICEKYKKKMVHIKFKGSMYFHYYSFFLLIKLFNPMFFKNNHR
jgi:hypothetical protein